MNEMGMGRNIPADPALIHDIQEAVTREVHAYNYYQKLAELAPNDQYRGIILKIQRDEAKHYHWFTMILNRMGAPLPQISAGELPQNFRDGVRTSIGHELDASEFYQDIAYRAADRSTEMHFMHASHDEQRHAAWFEFMLTNL